MGGSRRSRWFGNGQAHCWNCSSSHLARVRRRRHHTPWSLVSWRIFPCARSSEILGVQVEPIPPVCVNAAGPRPADTEYTWEPPNVWHVWREPVMKLHLVACTGLQSSLCKYDRENPWSTPRAAIQDLHMECRSHNAKMTLGVSPHG